jgi:hypothetical protein
MPYARKSTSKPRRLPSKRPTTTLKTMRRVAKQTVLKMSEVKRHQNTTGILPAILPDNISRLLISNCLNISQDDTGQGGTGRSVQCSGVSIKMQFRPTSGHAPYFKLFVVESNPANINTTASIFEGLIGNAMLDNVKKEYKVLKTLVITPQLRSPNSSQGHIAPWQFRTAWIPLKKKITYKSDAMTTSINKSIAVYAVAYSEGIATSLDIATCSVYSTMYFRDF